MISTIKNNIKKDSNPKIQFLSQFSEIVNKKIEENVNSKKEKAFYDNVFLIMIYGISLLLISSSLSVFFSFFSTVFIFSMLPKNINEMFIGVLGIFYFLSSFAFVFMFFYYFHKLIVSVTRKVPFLKNITNYFIEKKKLEMIL